MKITALATADTSLVNNNETVIVGPVSMPMLTGDSIITCLGFAQVTSDAAATGWTFRVRRGLDASGALVGEANAEGLNVAAPGTEDHSLEVDDGPLAAGTYPYVLTATRAGAAGTSTCIQAHLTLLRG